MQPFQVKINNLGKLTDADIRIGSFTVFAGANNTGKSFVSKSLYSIFGAMNANHLAVVLGEHIKPIMTVLNDIKILGDFNSEHLDDTILAVKNLHQTTINIVATNDMYEVQSIEETLPRVRDDLNKIQNAFVGLKSDVNVLENSSLPGNDNAFIFTGMRNIEKHVVKLGEMKDENAKYFVEKGLSHEIYHNILLNFQVAKLYDLFARTDDSFYFNIAEIVSIAIKAKNVSFSVQKSGLHLLQKYSRVLYLESPLFWRMKNPLENLRNMRSFMLSERERITRVPKYFYDMADILREDYLDILREDYSGDHICPEVLKKLTGDDVLGGKIAIGETGELLFLEKGKSYPLSLAATGVANLGMLALLIEKNLMDKNTFLFIDEPEAHLHTAWQVEMAEALFALAKAGVNVVIATHSAEILKWLEVHVKENPDDKKLIALNHFCVDGTVKSNGGNFQDKLDAIQEELANPFYDLYYRGL